MNWNRAKTLMIVLLLVVNLLLGGRMLYHEAQERAIEARAMEDLCALLARNGLTARPEQIPTVLELTYDAVRSGEELPDPEAGTVRGLPVWGMASGQGELTVTPLIGNWLWSGALPIDGRPCFSAGYALLRLTDGWGRTGILERSELGFSAALIAPDVIRLRPCWLFVISGEVYYVSAV
jgi:hypothetical protein